MTRRRDFPLPPLLLLLSPRAPTRCGRLIPDAREQRADVSEVLDDASDLLALFGGARRGEGEGHEGGEGVGRELVFLVDVGDDETFGREDELRVVVEVELHRRGVSVSLGEGDDAKD